MSISLRLLNFKLNRLYNRKSINYIKPLSLNRVNNILANENPIIRPQDNYCHPGGLINLNKTIKTILVPDLHGRVFFLKNILNHIIDEKSVLELLFNGSIQIVCVGDGFHSEARGKERWKKAEVEFLNGYKNHKYIDLEMIESLNLMEIIFLLKSTFPNNFHYLKGNHENILNENSEGNRSFSKFSHEGEMVKEYMLKFFRESYISSFYEFEKRLPILAVGCNFLVSHSEPRTFHNRSQVMNYYINTDVIYNLTWTSNSDAELGSVEQMLKHYLPENYETSLYFGGHRPVKDLYNLRARGNYVQFHNPSKQVITVLNPDKLINPDVDIYALDKDRSN